MADIMTAKELENYLKVSKSTIYKLASTGEIPGFKIGDSWRFDMNDIQKLIRGKRPRKIKKKMPTWFSPTPPRQELKSRGYVQQ